MEQQKLPSVTIALVLAILSFLCCCFGGAPGLILAVIAFFLIRKDEKTYAQNPDAYSNYSTLKTVKIISIIGMVIGLLYLIYTIWVISSMGGWEGYMEKVNEMMEQYQ
ncbi:CCC motif membrane protein [Croceitalea rosinachiae]|uniref:CCC motif membrane protein n=1 Tax=Croceitalea rosinachiae TaxID=3075596 RepID=A0ABU3AAL9_9FLAO|nr:CCC motif membrane protein [Croceitalea sp. F388]MDT0606960.1 CCC motif membrane protein [Croceitalea sp. F388]